MRMLLHRWLNNRFGFSLLEMLFVIAVLGIIVVIVAPRLSSANNQYELENSARQLVADLRWTAQIAANSVEPVKMEFSNTAPYGYKVVKSSPEIVLKPTHFLPASIKPSHEVSPIMFDVYGRPAGLSNIAISLQNSAGQSRTVNIDAVTGRVWLQ